MWIQLVSIYISPTIRPGLNTTSSFSKFLNSKNCAFGDQFSNPIGIWLSNFCLSTNFAIINPDTPSCFRSINGSFIDKFLSRNMLTQITCQTIPSFSDHFQICTHRIFTNNQLANNLNTIKIFSWAKIAKLKKFIFNKINSLNIPIDANISVNQLDHYVNQIHDICVKAVELYVPTAQVNYSKIILSSRTIEIRKTFRNQIRHFNRNKMLNPASIDTLKNEIKLAKKLYIENLRLDVTNYFKNLLVNVYNIHSLYSTVRNKTHSSKFITPVSISDGNGNVIQGEQNICNSLAKNFCLNHNLSVNRVSKFESNVHKFIGTLQPKIHIILSKNCTANQDTSPCVNPLLITTEEVKSLIDARNGKSSAGMDKLPNNILKLLDSPIITFFAIIFNHCIALGHFPSIWKNAIVTPIPKFGKDTSLLTNWRPISLLSCLSLQ